MSHDGRDLDPLAPHALARDSLEGDARALFAAGAREQAPARLRAALLARAGADVARTEQRTQASAPGRRARSRIGMALAAAAGVLAAFSIWGLRHTPTAERLLISAEHAPFAAPAVATLPERTLPAQTLPAQTLAEPTAPKPTPPAPSRAIPNAPRALRPQPPHARTSPVTSSPVAPTPAPAVAEAVVPPATASLPAPAARPEAADLSAQLELLQSVQRALRAGQDQRALELLDSPGSQLERGDFAAEARLMRIEALAGSGRRAEAASLARDFLRLFPHSPLADRARRFGSAATP